MPLSTQQRQDEGIDLIPYDTYANGGVRIDVITDWPGRIRRPVAAVIAMLRVGSFEGYDVDSWLDLWVQTRLGSVWFDVMQFDRVNFSDVPSSRALKISATTTSGTLLAGSIGVVGNDVVHYIGEEWRCRYTMNGDLPTTSFTFGVNLIPVG